MENPMRMFENKTLSQFVGLQECLTLVTLKNSSELTPSGYHEKESVPIFKKSGKILITPQRYMDLIELFQPDFFTTLADGDTFEDSPKKRVMKASERSEEFFFECISRRKSSKILQALFMIASVEGGCNQWERKRCLGYLKENEKDIDGYFIDGLHRNGAEATYLSPSSLKDIVDQTVKMLPDDKLKLMMGAFLPTVTLELIGLGIDVLDSSFADIVTSCNRAITFNFDLDNPNKAVPEIDLMDGTFKDDFTPFIKGCECYACRKHSRAYVNHLLNTRELLGPALLSVHNIYFYTQFFKAIREAIQNDNLPKLIKLVSSQYDDFINILIYKVPSENDKKEK